MLKKIMCLAACLVMLLLPSCAESGGTTGGNTGDGVPCPIEGLEWGMSADECLAALSLAEEDVQYNMYVGGGIDNSVLVVPLSGREAFGYPVKRASLTVIKDYMGLPVGLSQVEVEFDPAPSFEELKEVMKEKVTPYLVEDPENPDDALSPKQFNTTGTLADADSSLVEQYFPLERWFVALPDDPDADEPIGKEDVPLGSVTVKKADLSYGCVFIDNFAATIIKAAEKAVQ